MPHVLGSNLPLFVLHRKTSTEHDEWQARGLSYSRTDRDKIAR